MWKLTLRRVASGDHENSLGIRSLRFREDAYVIENLNATQVKLAVNNWEATHDTSAFAQAIQPNRT